MVVVFVCDSPAVDEGAACPLSTALTVYFVAMIGALSASELLIMVVIRVSSRGTIMNDAPRRSAGALLIARGLVRLCEFGFSVFAATFVFAPLLDDEQHASCAAVSPVAFYTARVSAVLGVLLVFGSMSALAILYDPLGRARIKNDAQKFEERASRMYRKRCVL